MEQRPRLGPGEIPARILRHLGTLRVTTVEELMTACGLSRRQTVDGIALLRRERLMRRHRRAEGTYRLTWEGTRAAGMGETITSGPKGPTGPKPRRAEGFRDRVWRSVRIRRTFTAAEVALDAARDEKDAEKAAARYLKLLAQAGFLVVVRGGTRQDAARRPPILTAWRLVRDPGPLAPVWDGATGTLRDRNGRKP